MPFDRIPLFLHHTVHTVFVSARLMISFTSPILIGCGWLQLIPLRLCVSMCIYLFIYYYFSQFLRIFHSLFVCSLLFRRHVHSVLSSFPCPFRFVYRCSNYSHFLFYAIILYINISWFHFAYFSFSFSFFSLSTPCLLFANSHTEMVSFSTLLFCRAADFHQPYALCRCSYGFTFGWSFSLIHFSGSHTLTPYMYIHIIYLFH